MRLLFVHAHPDDETIATGATIAHYAALGAYVTVLTCTLGEQGEILVPALAGLEADRADQLGGFRIGELAGAMAALGVSDHRWLGGAGRYRDSGMMGSDANRHPRAFWRADTDRSVYDAAVAEVAAVIREVRPQVVVTYDEFGDYGHPDHIMANRVTTAAVEATDGIVDKFYWTATPRSVLARSFERVAADPDVPFEVADEPAFGVADDVVTTRIDASARVAQKRAALEAHATQVLVHGDFFALSNRLGRDLDGVEYYRLVGGPIGPVGADGLERDLFAGLT